MTPREELEQLRAEARLAALESKAGGGSVGAPVLAAPEASSAPAPAFQRAGDKGAFGAGVAQGAIKGYMGLKGLLPGGIDDEDRGILKEIEKEAATDPDKWTRMGGEVLGTGAASAAGGGAALTKAGLKAAAALPSALKWPIGKEFIGSAWL